MVAMSKLASRQRFPFHIVFAIGRRDDDGLWLGALEQDAFECLESRRVEVFDDFYHGGGIETGESLVSVNERAVKETQPFLLNGRQAVVMQTVAGDFERAMRNVHAHDFGKLLFLEERLKQTAFAAAQVQNASCTTGFQRGHHRAETLLVEADAPLDSFFLRRVSLSGCVWIGLVFFHEL